MLAWGIAAGDMLRQCANGGKGNASAANGSSRIASGRLRQRHPYLYGVEGNGHRVVVGAFDQSQFDKAGKVGVDVRVLRPAVLAKVSPLALGALMR